MKSVVVISGAGFSADNVAAASNHADAPKLGARLDTIYRKLIKVLGRRS